MLRPLCLLDSEQLFASHAFVQPPELGMWNEKRAVKLSTNAQIFPLWTATVLACHGSDCMRCPWTALCVASA